MDVIEVEIEHPHGNFTIHTLAGEFITPLFDRVVIEEIEPAEYSGAIFIPESQREKTYEGIVTAIGPETKYVKVGDRVSTAKYGGSNVVVYGQKRLVLEEQHVTSTIAIQTIIESLENNK